MIAISIVAIVVSALALVAAGASAWYARQSVRVAERSVFVAEDAKWLAQLLQFEATIENPNSGSARLVLRYQDGPPLDDVQLDLLPGDQSPATNFGVGRPEGSSWPIGPMRVGDRKVRGIIQMVQQASAGPPYRYGLVGLRLRCRGGGGHEREVSIEADFPGMATVSSYRLPNSPR